MLPEKPYALSCDRNSEPILEALKGLIGDRQSLLELGAGTGQHAIFMAPHLPNLTWTLADLKDRHDGIKTWLKDFPRSNVRGPIEYSFGETPWPKGDIDCVFTANTLHIVSWELCLKLFEDLANLKSGSLFIVYGAFNYGGEFTSESNKKFEGWLKERDPKSGIRDFEKVRDELALKGFSMAEDRAMPANNRLLIFSKD